MEEIAKSYLAENECSVGEKFNDNLNNVFRQKIIDSATDKKAEFQKVKLKPEIEEKIRNIINNSNNKENSKEKINTEVDKIVTEEVKEKIISKLSIEELTDLMSKTLETKGSVEISKEFKNLEEPVENLNLLNKEAVATTQKEIYSTEQILNLIMNKDIME